jgi:membrane fusion protein (multidrug efflux system)
MKKKPIIIAVIALVVVALIAVVLKRFGIGESEKKSGPIARVQVVKVQRKVISEKAIVYGSVVAQPGKTHSVSVAFETRVRHILVAPGQFVQENDPLTEIEPSPAAQLQMQQAKNASEAAQKELNQTQERFKLKLATNQDLSAAEKTARDAEAQLTSLQRAGAGADNRIRAGQAGVVAKVDVQDGQIVPAGGPLIEIVAENEIEVKLGVEAEDLPAVPPGASISIFPINDPTASQVEGSVRLVTRRIDPTTRLVDVYVSLPEGTKLLLDGYVRGEVQHTEKNALVVPRSAVLPNESRSYDIFTVVDGKAVKHTVKVGLQNSDEAQIIGDDLHENDSVVTVGNSELEEGMAVEIQKAK